MNSNRPANPTAAPVSWPRRRVAGQPQLDRDSPERHRVGQHDGAPSRNDRQPDHAEDHEPADLQQADDELPVPLARSGSSGARIATSTGAITPAFRQGAAAQTSMPAHRR